MQNVASGTNWNYLPSDWTTLQNTLNGAGGAYSALAANVQAATSANAVLSPAQLAALSPDERAAIQAQRQSAAYLQALSQQALSTTSSRFASIQQLINAIPTATDQKGILELQARIGAEQGLLANEQTKLQVLYQAAQADEAAAVQRTREQAIASVGSLRTLPAMGFSHAVSARCTAITDAFRDRCHDQRRRRLCTGAGSGAFHGRVLPRTWG
jgi:type IV secretion system protein VirB5